MAKAKRPRDDGTLVYSSGPDGSQFFLPGGKPVDADGSPASSDRPPAEQTLRVELDLQAGHGKSVTRVRGFALTSASLDRLAKELKRKLGAGGRVEGATLVFQGDHVGRLRALLPALGFGVKGA